MSRTALIHTARGLAGKFGEHAIACLSRDVDLAVWWARNAWRAALNADELEASRG